MNALCFPQSAALNEPVNEVMRLASGIGAGQPVDDQEPGFYMLWGIVVLGAVLNLIFFWAFRRRMNKGGQPRLLRYLIVPIGLNLLLLWFMFIGFPSSMDSSYWNMPPWYPDIWLIFLISAGVILLTIFIRVWAYFRSRNVN